MYLRIMYIETMENVFAVYHISNLMKYTGTEACYRRHKRQTDNVRTKYDLHFSSMGRS